MIALDDHNLGTRITPNLIRHSDRSGITGPTSSSPTFKTNFIAWLAHRLKRHPQSPCEHHSLERLKASATGRKPLPPRAPLQRACDAGDMRQASTAEMGSIRYPERFSNFVTA